MSANGSNGLSSLARELQSDPVIEQHPLAIKGRYIHPSDVCQWHLAEAIAWVATRDLGLVTGVSAYLADPARPPRAQAEAALKILDSFPHCKPADLGSAKPEEMLRTLLAAKMITAKGCRGGQPDEAHQTIPAEDWIDGVLSLDDGGSWKGNDPLPPIHWIDLRFERGRVMTVLPEPTLPQVLPAKGTWVPIIDALMWRSFRHAVPLARLRMLANSCDGPSLEHFRKNLQRSWSGWLFEIRDSLLQEIPNAFPRFKGTPVNGRKIGPERLLVFEHLFQCNCLDLVKMDVSGRIVAALLEGQGDDRYSLVPAALRGFLDVSVHRSDLLNHCSPREVSDATNHSGWIAQKIETSETLEQWLQRMFVRFQDKPVPEKILLQQARERFSFTLTEFEDAYKPPPHLIDIWSKTGPRGGRNRAYPRSLFN